VELLIMKFSPHSCYFTSLRPKYSLQHSILKNIYTLIYLKSFLIIDNAAH
jgi:hypothetical protein